MSIRALTISMLVLGGLAVPARATIVYCNNGCTSNSGMAYAAFQTAASAFNYNFTAPINFVSGGLNGSGVYSDSGAGTGNTNTGFALFRASDGAAQTLQVNGTDLKQSLAGVTQIALPANTYAFAMFVTATTFSNPYVELGATFADFNGGANANYQLVTTGSSDPQFFGIISTTPLVNLYLGTLTGSGGALSIQSFELGTQDPAAETPEISTLALIGTGLIGMRVLRRRQRTSLRCA